MAKQQKNADQIPLFEGIDLLNVEPVVTFSEEKTDKTTYETVDFSDPNRPKTCLEVDFPLLKVNQVASMESFGPCIRPIYKMSKWWARRSSTVFRQLLISSAIKAPTNHSKAAQHSWNLHYRKSLIKDKIFKNIKVADIFMGGGTTLVEASKLGFEVVGNDLNPIAWWVVKNELTQVKKEDVEKLAQYINEKAGLRLNKYFYHPSPFKKSQNAKIVYTFWLKHIMCSDPSCNHLTPKISSSIVAKKNAVIPTLENCVCTKCGEVFDLELKNFRMSPLGKFVNNSGTSLCVLEDEKVQCPHCKKILAEGWLAEQKNKKNTIKKKVSHTLCLSSKWLEGITAKSKDYFGGYNDAGLEEDRRWLLERSKNLELIEVRGEVPDELNYSNVVQNANSSNKTLSAKGDLTCKKCGRVQDALESTKLEGHHARFFPYMIHAHDKVADTSGAMYSGRFFDVTNTELIIESFEEYYNLISNKEASFMPKDEIWFGHKTHQRDNLPAHGYKYWKDLFNPRQLIVNSIILEEISNAPESQFSRDVKSHVFGAFQNFLRHNCMFTIWNIQADQLEPQFSNNNFSPKNNTVENSPFGDVGRGNFNSCIGLVIDGLEYQQCPYELKISDSEKAKTEKVFLNEPFSNNWSVSCSSSTDLKGKIPNESIDLIITDPPFGGNVDYAELADFFLVWMHKPLSKLFPDTFNSAESPKSLEAVSNKARHPGVTEDGKKKSDLMYDRLLTMCWKEGFRILKPHGLMAFTFHHDEDVAWINVLDSLFQSGFEIESTFPIRSDAIKGDSDFGSKKIEYDIVHVCKKRLQEPKEIFWATLRKKILESVKSKSFLLAQHKASGLHLADLEVMIRGEVLEQYSKFYGKVKKNLAGDPMLVKEILLEANNIAQSMLQATEQEKVPDAIDPETKIFLSLFREGQSIEVNAARKRLKGSGLSLEDLVALDWVTIAKVKSERVASTSNIASRWNSLSRKKSFSSDLDQVHFAINCCVGGKQLDGKPADLESWIESHYKSLLPSVVPLLKYMEGNHFGAEYKQAIGMAYRTMERTLNKIKETDGEYKKASDQLSLFE